MIEIKEKRSIKELWRKQIDENFNTVTYGRKFKDENCCIITGGTDGILRIYSWDDSNINSTNAPDNIQFTKTLESKGGPIFHIYLHDVTRLSSKDIIIADSLGTVTLFCNGQIFLRRSPDSPSYMQSFQVFETATGNINILTGSDDGVVQAFNAFNELWKIRLADINCNKTSSNFLSATSILATQIKSSSSPDIAIDYVVVADSDRNLHFIRNGMAVHSITTPSVVTSIVAGNFLMLEDEDSDDSATQLALACQDGFIWICADFQINKSSKYTNIGHPLTKLHSISNKSQSVSNFKTRSVNSEKKIDLLLCAGHFAMLFLLHHGEIIQKIAVSDWVVSICDINTEKESENSMTDILVGCSDSTLSLLQLT